MTDLPALRLQRFFTTRGVSSAGKWKVVADPFLIGTVKQPRSGWNVISDYRAGMPADDHQWERIRQMKLDEQVFDTRREALAALALALNLEAETP